VNLGPLCKTNIQITNKGGRLDHEQHHGIEGKKDRSRPWRLRRWIRLGASLQAPQTGAPYAGNSFLSSKRAAELRRRHANHTPEDLRKIPRADVADFERDLDEAAGGFADDLCRGLKGVIHAPVSSSLPGSGYSTNLCGSTRMNTRQLFQIGARGRGVIAERRRRR